MKKFVIIIFAYCSLTFCIDQTQKDENLKKATLCILIASELNNETRGTGNVKFIDGLNCANQFLFRSEKKDKWYE